jgi:thioredoxin-dependent peroxiredoxin
MLVPDSTFQLKNGPDWETSTTDDYFKGKRVVVFSLPGAFTPVCSSKQLPQYEEAYDEIISLGINAVYCISVNDWFVMDSWMKAQGVEKVEFIPDGDGTFTRDMDMLVNKPLQGFGMRSWRYAMVVNNKKIEWIGIEEGKNQTSGDEDPYKASQSSEVIKYLKSIKE